MGIMFKVRGPAVVDIECGCGEYIFGVNDESDVECPTCETVYRLVVEVDAVPPAAPRPEG